MVVLGLMVGWYVAYLYVGYSQERAAKKEIAQNSIFIPDNLFNSGNVIPAWLISIHPDSAELGKRVHSISTSPNSTIDPELFGHFKYLRNLDLMNIGGDVDEETLIQIIKHSPHLESMYIDSKKFTQAIGEVIAAHSKLKTVYIEYGPHELAGFKAVAQSKTITTVTLAPHSSLYVTGPNHQGKGVGAEEIRALHGLASILNLNLHLKTFSKSHVDAINGFQYLQMVYIGIRQPSEKDIELMKQLKWRYRLNK